MLSKHPFSNVEFLVWRVSQKSLKSLKCPRSVLEVPEASQKSLECPRSVPEVAGVSQKRPRSRWSVPEVAGVSQKRPRSPLSPEVAFAVFGCFWSLEMSEKHYLVSQK
jgi:hypothetical protein